MAKYVSANYVAKMIRDLVRFNSKGKKLTDAIWGIKTIASHWDPEYGCNLAWDDSISGWVTTREKLDYFNTACQAMANMYKVPVDTIVSWYYEIRPTMIVNYEGQEYWQMPSTRKVIEYLKAR